MELRRSDPFCSCSSPPRVADPRLSQSLVTTRVSTCCSITDSRSNYICRPPAALPRSGRMEPLPGKFGAGAALPPPGEPQILPRWAETPGPWAKSCPLRRVRARVAALLVSFYLTFSEVPSPPLRMSSFWELKNLFFERTPCCRSLQRHRMHVVFHPQSPFRCPAFQSGGPSP